MKSRNPELTQSLSKRSLDARFLCVREKIEKNHINIRHHINPDLGSNLNVNLSKEKVIHMKIDDVLGVQYQHYKTGKLYEVIGEARHSETLEEMIFYRALYHCEKFGNNQIWVRPKEMFEENVIYKGQCVARFRRIISV